MGQNRGDNKERERERDTPELELGDAADEYERRPEEEWSQSMRGGVNLGLERIRYAYILTVYYTRLLEKF